jgi:hypothetical protein
MPIPLCRQTLYVNGLDHMTYEEKRAAERAADLAKPLLQRQECRKDQQHRPLLLEPVIDRDMLERRAKLIKKMRLGAARLEPFAPVCPACKDYWDANTQPGFVEFGTGPNHFAHCCQWMLDMDEWDDTKPPTHAGYLNGLVYRLQKDPTDKDTLAELLYAVHDDAALEIYPGKFAEGYTVNESWTAEDTAKVIESAQRIAAEPLSNCVWPDDSDHTIEAAALRAQARRLAGMPEEMIEELAWQHEHPEPEPDWWAQLCGKPTAAQEPEWRYEPLSSVAEEDEESWTIYGNGTVTNGVSAAERDAADRQCEEDSSEDTFPNEPAAQPYTVPATEIGHVLDPMSQPPVQVASPSGDPQ